MSKVAGVEVCYIYNTEYKYVCIATTGNGIDIVEMGFMLCACNVFLFSVVFVLLGMV